MARCSFCIAATCSDPIVRYGRCLCSAWGEFRGEEREFLESYFHSYAGKKSFRGLGLSPVAIARYDLNDDGNPELIVKIEEIESCNLPPGGCNIFVFQKRDSDWSMVGHFRGFFIDVSSRKVDGYRTLYSDFLALRWNPDKKTYEESCAVECDLETGTTLPGVELKFSKKLGNDRAFLRRYFLEEYELKDYFGTDGASVDNLLVARHDLNDDAQLELLVLVEHGSHCGQTGCTIFIFERKDGQWFRIGTADAYGLTVSSEKVGGYRTITSDHLVYRWNAQHNRYSDGCYSRRCERDTDIGYGKYIASWGDRGAPEDIP